MRAGLWIVLLTCAGSLQLRGQAVALTGQVRDRNGDPVPNAEIALLRHDSALVRARADSSGNFRIPRLQRGEFTLRVRRLGYEPRDVDVTIERLDRPASIVVTLNESPAELNGVSVNGDADEPDTRLRDFYTRRATNSFGHYIDAAAIGKRHPQYLSEILRAVPGVRITASRRIGNTVTIRGCAPLVWIDGVRIPDAQLDEVVQPDEVAGMEVYGSFAGVPAQYFDRTATCGTILIWTRAK